MNVATLSLAGPTQVVTVFVPGAAAIQAALGNLTTTIPEPPDPPLPPPTGAPLPPLPLLAGLEVPPQTPYPPAALDTGEPVIVLVKPLPPAVGFPCPAEFAPPPPPAAAVVVVPPG